MEDDFEKPALRVQYDLEASRGRAPHRGSTDSLEVHPVDRSAAATPRRASRDSLRRRGSGDASLILPATYRTVYASSYPCQTAVVNCTKNR
jgi:hypothetical protein